MTENSITACVGSMVMVNGKRTAPSVSMLTPGMAPNSIPPKSPPTKTINPVESVNRSAVPFRNDSNSASYNPVLTKATMALLMS